MTHTPGPWMVDPLEIYNGSVADIYRVDDERGLTDYICELVDLRNAHLIAAAPDLLEACKLAQDVLEDVVWLGSDNDMIEKANAALVFVDRAIAEGESNGD